MPPRGAGADGPSIAESPIVVPLTPASPPPRISAEERAARLAALGPPPPFMIVVPAPRAPIPAMGLAPAPPLPAARDPDADNIRLMTEIGRPPPYRPIVRIGGTVEREAAVAPTPVEAAAPPPRPAPKTAVPNSAVPNPAMPEPAPETPPPRADQPVRYGEEPVLRTAPASRLPFIRDIVIGLLVLLMLTAGGLLLERRQVMRRYPATIPIFEMLHLTDRPSR
jgi:hypothetical protein